MRNFTASDLEVFLAYRNEPEVAKFQSWAVPYSREKGEAFIVEMKDIHSPRQGQWQWQQLGLELKETGELIGDVGLCIKENDNRQAVIGFTISSAFWNKGFATEALKALLDYLFEDIDLHRVTADCDTENTGSWKTLEKLGFRREAHFVESYSVRGRYASEYHYGLLQREWRTRTGQGNAC